MARVFMVGYPPPPMCQDEKIEAAHYRTWQFLQPLLADGHTLRLCAVSSANTGQGSGRLGVLRGHLQYYAMSFEQRGWVGQLQQAHDAFEPDCVVAVNFDASLFATKLRTSQPVWMDIYGDALTIMQAQAHRSGRNRGLATTIGFLRSVLQSGDIFSVCGTPQSHMLVGELAMTGRLSHETFGYDFVRVILPGAPAATTGVSRPHDRVLLAAQGISADDFVVLWCGGYNTWTDVDTLFAALELAMAGCPRLHYVSVGASTYTAPDNVYDRLLKMIDGSAYRDRFHMLGWRPWAEVSTYYAESDIGLNIDALHYETIYGTRTRLVEMMAAGLPVITSLGSELSYLLRDRQACLSFEIGDWRGLGESLLSVAADPAERARLAQTALAVARSDLSFAVTALPLRNWVRAPQAAPDRVPARRPLRARHLEYTARSAVRQALWRYAGLYR